MHYNFCIYIKFDLPFFIFSHSKKVCCEVSTGTYVEFHMLHALYAEQLKKKEGNGVFFFIPKTMKVTTMLGNGKVMQQRKCYTECRIESKTL